MELIFWFPWSRDIRFSSLTIWFLTPVMLPIQLESKPITMIMMGIYDLFFMVFPL